MGAMPDRSPSKHEPEVVALEPETVCNGRVQNSQRGSCGRIEVKRNGIEAYHCHLPLFRGRCRWGWWRWLGRPCSCSITLFRILADTDTHFAKSAIYPSQRCAAADTDVSVTFVAYRAGRRNKSRSTNRTPWSSGARHTFPGISDRRSASATLTESSSAGVTKASPKRSGYFSIVFTVRKS